MAGLPDTQRRKEASESVTDGGYSYRRLPVLQAREGS